MVVAYMATGEIVTENSWKNVCDLISNTSDLQSSLNVACNIRLFVY
jgi:hypothetical protein